MMKRCDKPGCNILYNEVYQTPVKEKTDNDIIRGYLYEIIRREKLKNNNNYGVWKTIVQFLQQEVDKLSS